MVSSLPPSRGVTGHSIAPTLANPSLRPGVQETH
jgi:hypothetical protein